MDPVVSPDPAPSAPAGEVLVEASALAKRFGPVQAVQGVSFQVRRGELVGFLGPNGAGKSTTMRMLTGYLRPDQGHARLGGREVADPEARRVLGYLPEHTPLHREMRVDRFLAHAATLHGLPGGARRRDAVERVVDRCDLEGYAHRRIHTLSKGYRQRVGLAQALIHDPDVLVLDEPTSGLDPREIVRIRDLVARLARDKTVLLSTHVLPEVEEVCRRVLILSGGRLVADGTPDELASAEGERLVVEVDGPAPALLAEALGALEGVAQAEVSAPLRGGSARCALQVASRRAAAPAVQQLAATEGWTLLELRHELATLEQIFLSRTRGGPAEEVA